MTLLIKKSHYFLLSDIFISLKAVQFRTNDFFKEMDDLAFLK
jgi:hypothetical protein